MEIRLERLRLQEALCARDTVAKNFTTACISIREKTATIERLQSEKGDLEKQLKLLNGRQATLYAPNTTTQIAEDKRKLVTEVARLAEILRSMQDEIPKVGKAHIPGLARGHRTPLLETENACQVCQMRISAST